MKNFNIWFVRAGLALIVLFPTNITIKAFQAGDILQFCLGIFAILVCTFFLTLTFERPGVAVKSALVPDPDSARRK